MMKPTLLSHYAVPVEHKPNSARGCSEKNAFLRSIAKALLAFSSVLLLTSCSGILSEYGYADCTYNSPWSEESAHFTDGGAVIASGNVSPVDRSIFEPTPKNNGLLLRNNHKGFYRYPGVGIMYDLYLFGAMAIVKYDSASMKPQFFVGVVPAENKYTKTHKLDWTCEKLSTGKDAPTLRKNGNTWIFSEVMKLIPSPNVMKEGKELYCLYTIKFNPDSRYKCAEKFKMQVRKKK